MQTPLTILAIETSCDETACSIVQKYPDDPFVTVVSETTATSLAKHIETRGIVPEVAAREQLKSILPVIQETLKKADSRFQISDDSKIISDLQKSKTTNLEPRTQNLEPAIDYIAVTTGPGLIGSLLVGVETARALSLAWNKPLIPVNHVQAHPYANFISETGKVGSRIEERESRIRDKELRTKDEGLRIEERESRNENDKQITNHKTQNTDSNQPTNRPTDNQQLNFPLLSWVISGGHTDLYYMESHTKITKLGGTVDDSAGECFDKCARVLGYDYPGGPNIEKLATEFQESSELEIFRNSKFEIRNSVMLPRPLLHSKDFRISFSGLKTAFLREFQKIQTMNHEPQTLNLSLAHELQSAITDIIVKKTELALEKYPDTKGIIISGGVAANQFLSNALKKLTTNHQTPITFSSPPLKWCTDNASMIGAYALFHLDSATTWQDVTVKL